MSGISCQIIRNPYNNQIETVEASNGNNSILYQDALERTQNPEEALNIWTVNYTDNFQEILSSEKNIITPRPSPKKGFLEVSNEGATISYKKIGNNINLEMLETSPELRGRGYAKRLLQDFVKQADINGDTIRAMVSPIDTSTQAAQIIHLNQINGFVFDEQFGIPSDFEMIRYPKRSNSNIDVNGEAKLEFVLNYINSSTSQTVEPLTAQERQSVKNMLMGANIPSSEVLKQHLNRIFPQGQFNPNALQQSDIFNSSEKNFIENNKSAREELNRLNNQLNNQEEVIYNDVDYNENFIILSGVKNKYGKDEVENPLVVEQVIAEAVSGIENRDAFDTAFNSLEYESIVEEYNTNEDFAQSMYEQYSRYKVMPQQRIEDGELTNTQATNRTTTVENTINLDNINFREDIQLLSQIPNDIWQDSKEEVEAALESIEQKGVAAAIDLQGLRESYASKTRVEIIDFLATLNNLENVPSEENFNTFLEAYTDFFEVQSEQAYQIEEMSPENRQKSLVYVNNPLSEYEMFEQFSMVKVDNNVYQKIAKQSLDGAYETIYAQATVRDNRILPNEAYFGTDTIDNQKLQDERNKPEIMNNIRYFIERNITNLNLGVDTFNNEEAQLLLLYKYYFNNPINIVAENYITEDLQAIEDFDGDSQYLSSDYISDFQSEKLRQREQESEVYDSVYSKFKIDEQGIKPIYDDIISIQNLRSAIEEQLSEKQYNNLKNYSVVSKNRAIKQLFPIDPQTPTINTKPQERIYYQNNIESLPLFKENYTKVDTTSVMTKETANDFININNNLFEKAQDTNGYSFYRQIPTNSGNFNIIETQKPVNKFAYEQISSYIANSETQENTNNKYTQNQLERINENQFDCN